MANGPTFEFFKKHPHSPTAPAKRVETNQRHRGTLAIQRGTNRLFVVLGMVDESTLSVLEVTATAKTIEASQVTPLEPEAPPAQPPRPITPTPGDGPVAETPPAQPGRKAARGPA